MSELNDIAMDVFARSASALALPPPPALFALLPVNGEGDADREDFWFLWEAAAPFLANARIGAPVADGDRDVWAGWLKWATELLEAWDRERDGAVRELDVALALLDLTQRELPAWESVPMSAAANTRLRDTVETRLQEAAGRVAVVDFCGRSLQAFRPVLLDPEGETGWAEVLTAVNQLEVISPGGHRALAQLAWRLWPDKLAALLDDQKDVLAATALAADLGPVQAFALGVRCRSPIPGFAAVCAHTELRTPLTVEAQRELEELLVKTSTDAAVWRGWMKAINRYPVRHPRLQEPLGWALARSSEEAFQAWLAVIELQPRTLADALQPVDQRGDASTCLRAFSEAADAAVRAAGWGAVWARWKEWDFDRREGLMKVHGSDIDLGVVGYALEVMRTDELEAAIETEANNLNSVFTQRWPSVIDLMTAANTIQSRLQPLAHAQALKRSSNQLDLATVRYGIQNPDMEWRLRRAGCE